MRGPAVGGILQSVMDMHSHRGLCLKRLGGLPRHMQQYGGVEPAAEANGEQGLAVRQALRFERSEYGVEQPDFAQPSVSLKRP